MNGVKILISTALFITSSVVFLISINKSKNKQFYSDTFFLWPLGIYVWGDGLVLGLFWMLSAIIFLFISPINILRFYLLFLAIRSAYEVIYWLNHQANNKKYEPPLFRNISWLDAHQGAILYQVANSCLMLLALFFLMLI